MQHLKLLFLKLNNGFSVPGTTLEMSIHKSALLGIAKILRRTPISQASGRGSVEGDHDYSQGGEKKVLWRYGDVG